MKRIFGLVLVLLMLTSFQNLKEGWAWPFGPQGSGSGTSGADASGYYVVTRSTNAPTNAANLGAGTTGLVFCTVAGSVCTFSVKAIGTDVQAYDADLTTYAGITPSANMQTFLGSADFAAMRTNMGLVIGTNVQAYNADLATLAAGGTANCIWGEKSDSSGIECKTSLSIATLDLTSSTSSIPFPVGTGTVDAGMTAAGKMYFESDTEILSIGDGATIINLDMTPNVTYTFPAVTASLAPLVSPSFTTPTLGAATGTSLALTGNLTGLTPPVTVLIPNGTQDGGDDQAIMTDGGIDIGANALVGMTVYNITDGSSCTITANAATTITCTLAGGTGNDWDNGDAWQVGPGPAQSGSMFYVGAAGTIRHPATAGYVAGYYVNVAGAVIVDMASESMIFYGDLGGSYTNTGTGGDCVESPATQGSFYFIHNKSATEAIGMGYKNTWIDGGAS